MTPRDPAEVFRAASPLELFFDLIFVVAVSFSSAQLHVAEAGAHAGSGVAAYLMVFFAIWWAWMNFTWFASAFDVDDWLYRVLTLTQMAGVLVLAVGTGAAMTAGDFRVVILGYVIMRFALVLQWLRAARSHPDLRRTALRYALGVALVQLAWLALPFVPSGAGVAVFLLLVLAELAVPIWAESARTTPWHPAHIADRYGSFTLIVLGESVLASTTAVVNATTETDHLGPLIMVGACGLVLAAGMWWLYFAGEANERLGALRTALFFGYGHYAVFAAAGAFSAGISVVLEAELGHAEIGMTAAALTLTVPIALFVLGAWLLVLRYRLSPVTRLLLPLGAVILALCALTPWPLPSAALVMILLVALVERERTAE